MTEKTRGAFLEHMLFGVICGCLVGAGAGHAFGGMILGALIVALAYKDELV